MAEEKVDFKKTMKALYAPSAKDFVLVEVPRMQFVKVDGHGDPNSAPAYARAVEWLYGVSYALKFAAKSLGRDYGVPPLEGLWWADDNAAFTARAKDQWHWTMMIMAPEFITRQMYEAAVEKAGRKLGRDVDLDVADAEVLRLTGLAAAQLGSHTGH